MQNLSYLLLQPFCHWIRMEFDESNNKTFLQVP